MLIVPTKKCRKAFTTRIHIGVTVLCSPRAKNGLTLLFQFVIFRLLERLHIFIFIGCVYLFAQESIFHVPFFSFNGPFIFFLIDLLSNILAVIRFSSIFHTSCFFLVTWQFPLFLHWLLDLDFESVPLLTPLGASTESVGTQTRELTQPASRWAPSWNAFKPISALTFSLIKSRESIQSWLSVTEGQKTCQIQKASIQSAIWSCNLVKNTAQIIAVASLDICELVQRSFIKIFHILRDSLFRSVKFSFFFLIPVPKSYSHPHYLISETSHHSRISSPAPATTPWLSVPLDRPVLDTS